MLVPTDRELVLRAQAGEVAALGALLERHRATMVAAARAMLGFGGAADDAVQDACLVALRRIGDLRDPGAARAWLLAVLRNVCRMTWRSDGGTVAVEALDPADRGATPEEHLDGVANADWLWSALHRLPESLRLTVMLRHFGTWSSYAEVAEITGVPVGTVRSRLSIARDRLAGELLATADAAHDAAREERDRRRAEFDAAVADLNAGVGAASLADVYDDDVVVELAAGGGLRGKRALRSVLDQDVHTGTRLHMTRVLTSGALTVVEGRLESPADAPDRCPATTCQIHHRERGRTRRARVYFASAESADAPTRPDA